MHDTSPTGVIFDMDGVLVDSAAAHLQSWQQLAREFGREVTEEQFAATFGQRNRDIIPVLIGDVPGATVETLGDRKEEIYRDLIRDSAPIVEGAIDLVCSLHKAGVSLAVGSSGPRANIDLVLDVMGVGELISVVVSSDEVTRGKPDPQVFTIACQRLRIEPARCIVIEDAPAGVEAAQAAGTRVVAVLLHHPLEAFRRPDHVVSRLADLTVGSILTLMSN